MTRRILMFLGLLFCVILYQSLLADLITIGTARPDLILVIVVWLTLTRDLGWGAYFGFVAGVFEDSHSPQFLGLGACLKVMAAVAVFLISNRVRTDRLLIRIGLVAGIVITHDILYFLIVYSVDIQLEFLTLLNTIIPTAIYTSILAAGVLYLSERRLTVRFES